MEDKLKRYEKVEFLGEGQFATVYKARDSVNGTIVAVKKIIVLDDVMPYSLHCTDISGDHVASIINVNEDGNGTGNKVYQTTRLHISKTSAFLCDFLVTECDTLGKPGDVVLHKIKLGSRAEAQDGINRTALREIKLLQELKHPNIINLMDVFGHKSNVSLVFDFMDTDLEVIIKDSNIVLTPANIKAYLLMTLQGLEYLHINWILHRDLKPNNLLVNCNGVLKIGDFGLAKFYGSPNRVYTHQVVTRWYRAPELLFGARMYGTGIDMWAVGCILAELLLRVPFLPGDSDLDQLTRIFQVLGTPTDETWPNLKELPDFIQFKTFPGTPLRHIFTAAGDDLLDLLAGLLSVSPLKRYDCHEALQAPYFSNKPAPTQGPQLPLPSSIRQNSEHDRPNLKRKLQDTADGVSHTKRLVF